MRRTLKRHPKAGLAVLAFTAFIALGMPDGLTGVAWPSIRTNFAIPLDALGMFLTAGMTGYLVSSALSGPVVGHWGVGRVLAVSCALTGASLIGYTLVPVWGMMVFLGLVSGLGAGAIDSGLNAYVAAYFGERMMQWLHASYGIGITSGPVIMTFALTSLNSWRLGYIMVGLFQLILALCFAFTLTVWEHKKADTEKKAPGRSIEYQTPLGATVRRPAPWMSAGLFFFYTGAEVALGTWAYTLLVESRGIDAGSAGLWVGSYWAFFTVGRLAAGLYAKRLGIHFMVISSLMLALLGAAWLWWNPGDRANLWAVALIGLAIAPVFAALMSGTSGRVGEHFAANTIGMQLAAGGLGAAIIPGLVGVLARRTSLEVIPLCLMALFAVELGLYTLAVKTASRSGHSLAAEGM